MSAIDNQIFCAAAGCCALLASVLLACAPMRARAAESWGGSVGVTSDYFVRGISRSGHQAALQTDLHFATRGGLIGGAFASSVQIAPGEPRNAELTVFLGFVWNASDILRVKFIASHYSYPWNDAGAKYDYDELGADIDYGEWLTLSAAFSPNSPLYVVNRGLIGAHGTSAELSVHTPWRHRLAAIAGAGYAQFSEPHGDSYGYWSAGVLFDLAPFELSLSYVDTSDASKYLYFNAAARNDVAATLLWRF
jgi:uncharacterized protein (TIGR02001 family)